MEKKVVSMCARVTELSIAKIVGQSKGLIGSHRPIVPSEEMYFAIAKYTEASHQMLFGVKKYNILASSANAIIRYFFM